MNIGSRALRFATLVGKLKEEKAQRAYDKFQNDLIDFDTLHSFASKSSHDLAEKLHNKYRDNLIIDYGDEPLISQYHQDIYDEILAQFELKFPKIINEAADIARRTYITCLAIKKNSQPLEKSIKELKEECENNGDILSYIVMTSEIINAIYKFHYQKFERNFYSEIWVYSGKKSGIYKRFLFHPVILNIHYQIHFFIDEKKKNLTGGPRTQTNSENMSLLGGTPSQSSDQELAGIFNELEQEIAFQKQLIESINIFMTHSLNNLPSVYTSDKLFKERFNEFMNKENSDVESFLDCVRAFFEEQAVDLEEPPVYSQLDLWLVYFHTFIALTNSYGLAITSYLYVGFFNIPTGVSGAIQAVVPFGSFIFGFFWNYLTGFKSYKLPYLLSIFLLCLSNVIYYIANIVPNGDPLNKAINIEGTIVLVIARLILGIGGARLMTRKFVALSVKPWAATKYSAILVASSAFATCIGPGLQAVMLYLPNPPVYIGKSIMDVYNIFAFVYIWVWVAVFILFLLLFTGYDKKKSETVESKKEKLLQIFYTLNRLEFKSILDKFSNKKAKKKPIILKKDNAILNESVEFEDFLNYKADQFIEENFDNPFLAQDVRDQLELLKQENENKPPGPEEVVKLNKRAFEDDNQKNAQIPGVNQTNILYSKETPIIPDNKLLTNTNEGNIERKIDAKFSNLRRSLEWKSKIRYLVYHPNAPAFYGTFCLSLAKVVLKDLSGIIHHRTTPIIEGVLRK